MPSMHPCMILHWRRAHHGCGQTKLPPVTFCQCTHAFLCGHAFMRPCAQCPHAFNVLLHLFAPPCISVPPRAPMHPYAPEELLIKVVCPTHVAAAGHAAQLRCMRCRIDNKLKHIAGAHAREKSMIKPTGYVQRGRFPTTSVAYAGVHL